VVGAENGLDNFGEGKELDRNWKRSDGVKQEEMAKTKKYLYKTWCIMKLHFPRK
jgi:hypothetical protein